MMMMMMMRRSAAGRAGPSRSPAEPEPAGAEPAEPSRRRSPSRRRRGRRSGGGARASAEPSGGGAEAAAGAERRRRGRRRAAAAETAAEQAAAASRRRAATAATVATAAAVVAVSIDTRIAVALRSVEPVIPQWTPGISDGIRVLSEIEIVKEITTHPAFPLVARAISDAFKPDVPWTAQTRDRLVNQIKGKLPEFDDYELMHLVRSLSYVYELENITCGQKYYDMSFHVKQAGIELEKIGNKPNDVMNYLRDSRRARRCLHRHLARRRHGARTCDLPDQDDLECHPPEPTPDRPRSRSSCTT